MKVNRKSKKHYTTPVVCYRWNNARLVHIDPNNRKKLRWSLNCTIEPDLSNIVGVPLQYWKKPWPWSKKPRCKGAAARAATRIGIWLFGAKTEPTFYNFWEWQVWAWPLCKVATVVAAAYGIQLHYTSVIRIIEGILQGLCT